MLQTHTHLEELFSGLVTAVNKQTSPLLPFWFSFPISFAFRQILSDHLILKKKKRHLFIFLSTVTTLPWTEQMESR